MAGLNSDVVLLLHCDGTDASTTFTDSSYSGKTVTANGNAQVDTAQSVFSGASLLLDGSGDYLSVGDSADWDFGTGDFTIDCRIRHNALGSDRTIIDINGGDGAGIWLQYQNAGNMRATIAGTTRSFATTQTTNTWYHIAITRNGTNLRCYQDGVQIGSTLTDSGNITGGTIGVLVGRRNGGSDQFNGWIDELRVVKGVAIWTGASFTVPTAPYGVDSLPISFFKNYKPA